MPATTTAASRDLTQRVDVETPELVVLSYTIAGVGSRVYAGLIDLLVCVGLFLAIILAGAMISARFGVHVTPDAVGAWAGAFILFAQFVVLWGYYVLCEGLADGQTFGKWRLGLRVVRDGGYSVGFAASATRNILRAIDMQPLVSYLFGISAIAISKSGKRLGDLVAGTIVVQERLVESPLANRSTRSVTPETPAVARLREEEFRLLERWYRRRQDLEPERRKQLTSQIVGRLSTALGHEDGTPAGAKLIRLYESERRARDAGAASRQETGAARERYAIISTGSPRWLAFAAVVTEAQRRGLKSLGEARVREFVSEYRMLSSDLARLQTATRDAASDELFYLSRLVGAAHNLLYKDRRASLGDVLRFVTGEVPAEIRRSWRPIVLAVVALFLPLTIAMTAVIQHPEVAPTFIPVAMLDRAQEGIKRAQAGTGYIEDPQIFRPILASSIIANNVQVTFFTFAGGITAGGLTMLLLLLNGVSIGGILGLYQSKGILRLILAFAAPHGVLELSAVCIAGGAGFLIAAALLIPGRRTRRRALAENGRRAITLVCGSSLLLVIAGSLEGFVSPIPYWPLELKLIVSALTTLFLVVYIRGGPRRKAAITRSAAIDAELLGLGSVGGTGV